MTPPAAGPGMRSATTRVPAAVPSVTCNSAPAAADTPANVTGDPGPPGCAKDPSEGPTPCAGPGLRSVRSTAGHEAARPQGLGGGVSGSASSHALAPLR